MKLHAIRLSCIAAALLSPTVFAIRGANSLPKIEQGHLSGLMAKITLQDGTTRTAKLAGLGCSATICSRTTMKGRSEQGSAASVWLDHVAAMQDMTDRTVVVKMKDGSKQQMSLVDGFRVLYIENGLGSSEKVELSKVKSVEFLGAPAEGARP